MRKVCLATVAAVLTCTGCTTVALNEYTRRQILSSGDCRDQSVLNCLAAVADDPDTLPSYALYPAGLTTFTDSVTVGHTVTYAPIAYTMEALALTGSRSPKPQWTFDPTVEYEKLTALHAACLWGIFGPERAAAQYRGILARQEDYLDQKPHFNVEQRLAKLPPGWLHVGSEKEVPPCARYKACKGKTWVWVLPEDHEAFAQFTLVLQDIATLDPAGYYSPPIVILLGSYFVTKVSDTADAAKAMTIGTSEFRAVKPEYKELLERRIVASLMSSKPIDLTRAQWLEYTVLYTGARTSATGVPATSLPARVLTNTTGGPPLMQQPNLGRPAPAVSYPLE